MEASSEIFLNFDQTIRRHMLEYCTHDVRTSNLLLPKFLDQLSEYKHSNDYRGRWISKMENVTDFTERQVWVSSILTAYSGIRITWTSSFTNLCIFGRYVLVRAI
jgi:hypothetical protein